MPLDIDTLRRYRQDAMVGQQWRYEAATAIDYFDSNQFDAATAKKMQDKGLPLIYVNVMKPTIDTAVGLLERSQTDWVVKPEDDDQDDIAQILTFHMKQAERATRADRTCLDAGAVMFKGGLGWVEVARNQDPFGQSKYVVRRIPYTEMWYDPFSVEVDFSDAEYLRRIKFFDRSIIKKRFPQAVMEIEAAGRFNQTMAWYEPQQYLRENYLRDLTQVSMELWGAGRDKIPLEEVQYRVQEPAHVFKAPGSNKKMLFQPRNPMHVMAYNQGIIDVEVALTRKSYQALYVGEVVLLDRPNPAGADRFTYTAFCAEREGRTGVPYSPISRSMMPLQDEINTRRAKMAYALQSTRVVATKNAVDDHQQAAEEVGRRNSYIELGERFNPAVDQFKIEDGIGMSDAQLKVYQESLAMMPQVSGVPLSLQGVHEGSIDSGKAVNAMADYGVNSLSRQAAHYREARRQVGATLLQYIIEDIGPQLTEIKGESMQGKRVTAKVNVPQLDQVTGATYIQNDLSAMKLNVVLDDVPQSATYRQQQFSMIMTALKEMPPEVQGLALPMMVEMSELPEHQKKEMADLLREKLGIAGDDPEKQAEMAQRRAVQEQAQRDQAQRQEQEHQIDIAAKAAKADNDSASAQQKRATAVKMIADAVADLAAQGQDPSWITAGLDTRSIQQQLAGGIATGQPQGQSQPQATPQLQGPVQAQPQAPVQQGQGDVAQALRDGLTQAPSQVVLQMRRPRVLVRDADGRAIGSKST